MGIAEDNEMYLETEPCLQNEAVPKSKFVPKRSIVAAVAIIGVLGCVVGLSFSPTAELTATDTFDMDNFYEILNTERAKVQDLNYSSTGFAKEDLDKMRQLFHVRKVGYMAHETADLKTASCAVDITHSVLFLERAALAITAATASCKHGSTATKNVQAACAADISAVYAAVSFVAEFISSAVKSCSENIQVDAACSAAITGIVGNTARIATSASFIAGNCKGAAAYGPALDDSVWQMTRRLRTDAIEPSYDENGMAMTSCVLDATQAANYLAAFGIAIDGATKSCDKHNLPHGLKSWVRYPEVHKAAKIYCAANIFNIMEALFAAAAFISTAVSQCAPVTNQDALCAGGATGVVAGSNGLLKSIMFTYGMCDKGEAAKGKAVTAVHAATVAVADWNSQPAWKRKSEKFAAKKFIKKAYKEAEKGVEKAKETAEVAKEHPVKTAKKAAKVANKAGGGTTVIHHTR